MHSPRTIYRTTNQPTQDERRKSNNRHSQGRTATRNTPNLRAMHPSPVLELVKAPHHEHRRRDIRAVGAHRSADAQHVQLLHARRQHVRVLVAADLNDV